MEKHRLKPLVLIILDGWGYREEVNYNAIAQAHAPQWQDWWQNYPHCLLDASGSAVGLPADQIGNSEVGHMHIGAGRIIRQDLSQINHDIEKKTFFNLPSLVKLCQNVKAKGTRLHILGLVSAGGIHAHEDHLLAFLELARTHDDPKISIHAFLDGRDTPPKSACNDLAKLEASLKNYPNAKISSICGRFFAMDRDQRWERTQEAYDLLCVGNNPHFPNIHAAIKHYYAEGISDEFIPATVIGKEADIIQDGDTVFFLNFRADRAIQLTESLTQADFKGFLRQRFPQLDKMVTMTAYAQHLQTEVVYSKPNLNQTLGEVIEEQGWSQLRIAETEKFPHVTYFLNGGRETPFLHEERILIPSPKVKTYNLMPEMRVHEITEAIINHLKEKKYPLIIANFANPDMVGHCGELKTTIQAIEALDQCFQEINQALKTYDAQAIITADHGNAELMYDEANQQNHTAHTMSPVPFLYIGKNWKISKSHGSLIDIAPTVLKLLNIRQPAQMSGESLLIQEP
jgi:2,3-bisphosphoglycerate-independent phosphoglycerate mutase